MARCAQRDQVTFMIIAGMTAMTLMVYLQVLHAAAYLAPPTVALEHLAA
jgi:hypothetical protein